MGITVGKLYDPSAVQFLGAIQNRDYTIGKAINELVIDLKNYALWNKMKAIYPMVGQPGVSSSFEVNLKDPNTFRGVFSGSWNFSSNGATPNGSTAYMDTKVNDLNDLGTNAAISVYLNGGSASTGGWNLGVFNGSQITGISINNNNSGENYINVRSSIVSNFTEAFTGGLYTGTTNGTNNVIYKNTTNRGSVSQLHNGINLTHWLGTLNNNGSGGTYWSAYRIALASFANSTFDTTDITNYYTAVQRFQTTLGRQV